MRLCQRGIKPRVHRASCGSATVTSYMAVKLRQLVERQLAKHQHLCGLGLCPVCGTGASGYRPAS